MNRLVNWFLQGILFLAPIAVTIWVLVGTFLRIDGLFGFRVPGLGVLVLVGFVIVFGFLASNFLTRRLLALAERFLDRLPFVKLLHVSLKELLGAFVGEKRRFDKPVVVSVGPTVRVFGFLTRESLDQFDLADSVAVYLPQSYHWAGQVLIVPRAQVTPLNATSADVMAFIVSGGVTGGAALPPGT